VRRAARTGLASTTGPVPTLNQPGTMARGRPLWPPTSIPTMGGARREIGSEAAKQARASLAAIVSQGRHCRRPGPVQGPRHSGTRVPNVEMV